jgi:hypothetical protein
MNDDFEQSHSSKSRSKHKHHSKSDNQHNNQFDHHNDATRSSQMKHEPKILPSHNADADMSPPRRKRRRSRSDSRSPLHSPQNYRKADHSSMNRDDDLSPPRRRRGSRSRSRSRSISPVVSNRAATQADADLSPPRRRIKREASASDSPDRRRRRSRSKSNSPRSDAVSPRLGLQLSSEYSQQARRRAEAEAKQLAQLMSSHDAQHAQTIMLNHVVKSGTKRAIKIMNHCVGQVVLRSNRMQNDAKQHCNKKSISPLREAHSNVGLKLMMMTSRQLLFDSVIRWRASKTKNHRSTNIVMNQVSNQSIKSKTIVNIAAIIKTSNQSVTTIMLD